ncbi:hypothetical protein Vretifemale_9103 [Volvox reticuliferus]|uniref:Guanylate cyclase domain-containing protein n=1 Tax=Volvox reticuliferus TaxID=1737510 RepID=A0A8J4FNU1_9CHLO|nr:hypothetical protein Vretifemale_9103 [Volvox reticuliferus]
MHVRSALFAALLLATRICAESNFCSIEAWKSAIDESCKSNGTEVARELILNASPCNSSPEFNKELRIFTPELYLNQTLQTRPFQGLETDGNSLSIVIVSGLHTNTVSASDELHHDIVSYYDGFVTEAEVLPEFALVDVVAPLDKAIISEPELNWFRISRFYRGFSATHSTRVYGVPLGGAGVFTFYRQDLFQKHHLTIPTTWQALLETATAWSAAPPEPGISPFCMSRSSYCARTVLLSIAAPYMQAFGTRDGFLIDPANGTVLLNSTGFKVALQTWQQLAALSTVDASCGTGSDHFTDGGCLMTVQLFEKFKVYASNTSGVSSKLGVALPPGSSSVMNRTTGKMEPCTYTSCPYARCALQQEDLTLGGGGSGSGSHGGDVSQLFNSAPFMWGGLVGMVSARNPARIQTQVLEYFSNLTSNRSLDNVLRKGSHIAPFRADHWSPAARRNWTDAGYVEAAVEQMLDVLRRLHACANVAPHLRLPGQEDVSRMLSSALANLTAGQTLEVVTATLQVSVEATLLARYGMVNGTYGFLGLYRQQLGYVESSSTDVPLPPDHGGTRGVSRQSVVVIAVVVGLVVLLGAVVVLEVRNKRRHKDLLGRVKPPLGDPDTTIVVTSIQDFDELWEVLNSDASERALQQFSDLMDSLLQRYSGYRRAPSEEEEDVVAAFHCPRDACEFALELQRRLLHLRWPKHVLEMKQFRPQYLAQTNRAASFNQGYNAARVPMPPLAGSMPQTEDDDKLFTLNTTENVRSFGEQCVASWAPADATAPDAELVFCGIRARVGVCAVGFSQLALDVDPGRNCVFFIGEAVEVATAAAAAAQGGMVLIPQSTFRQLHLEVLAEQCLFCHLGEYQLTAELPPMDLYLALDRQLLGRLALFGPLSCHMQWSQGAFAAPVHSASMVFTHVVGVQTLLAWNYDLMQDVIETFTKLAQVELQQAGGYLVEHVEGFMLTAFHSPADAILWGLRMQELMLKEDWPEELLAHELCEEVTVTVPVRGGDVTSATVFRGPRLKTGIDIGHVLARLHTMTGRMTYRGKVMNRAARISAAASSGQVLCSSEAWESCTASASALRLVSATSLGLFQLKGIQERIEVFHCTYQRHALSSTRRSSTVSVGLVSSSDNRRKSAVVLSSMSHASHHTTTYRTSLHNSVALEHVSASDTTGGRRGSQASSATLVGRGSLGGGQLSDMLHTVVADPDRTNASSVGPGPVLTTVTTNALRHRMALGPVLVGGADNVTASPGLASQTGSSHRSQGSGGAPANAPAPHAALAAVLQSRTRSASALQASNRVVPLRSASARTRRPLRLSSGAVASEPQVSLAAGASVPPALAAMKWNAGVAAPLSAMPSLAMAAAAAAAAAQERSNNNNSTNSPKHATALDLPRCVNGNGNMLDSASTLSNFGAVSGGANTESAATVTAAVYAVLPSVVLSGGVLGSSSGLSPAAHAYTHAIPISAVTTSLLDGCPRPGERLCSSGGGGCPASAASGGDGESEQDLHTVATIAAFVDSALQDRDRASIGAVPAVDGSQLVTKLQPRSQQRHPQQHQQQASSPFQFELVSSLEPLDENSPPVEDLGNAEKFADDADGNDGEDGMLDEGSRVETLEVTVSATGILRGALSGAASSSGFGGALGSSHGASPCAPISRCGSGTAGMSYLALGLSGGLGSIPGGITTTAGAGSHTSSCGSSGYGHVTYAHGQVTAARPQSAAIWRPSMSPAPHGISQGLAAVVESATGRHSGFASSADLFLPFPLGASSGGAVAGATNSTSSSMIATIRLGSPANGAEVRSGSTSSSANSPKHRPALDGVAVSMAPTSSSPMAMPQRHLASVHSSRLAGVAASAAAQLTAAGVAGRTSSYAGAGAACGRQAMGLQTTGAVPAMVDTTDARASAAVLPPADGAISTAAADADADADAKPTIFRVRAVTFDHNGSGDICGSMVGSVPENRFNRSYVTVTAAAAASSPVAMTSTASGRDGDNNCAGVGGGSSSGGRLRPNNRTGSCVSNDLISQAVSPASTWASGGSAGSATTNTTTINTTLAGAASISPAAASCASLDHSLQTRKLQLTQLQPQQQHPGTNTLRALLEGVGIGVTTGPGFDGSVMLPEFQRAKIRDDDVRAMKPRCSFIESQLGLRAADSSAEGGSCGGTDSVGANAAAAMAAVFGIEPPPCNEYTAAAVFGVGPPLNNFDDNAGSINVGGPTREQLERALELLGESRHAGGGEWR